MVLRKIISNGNEENESIKVAMNKLILLRFFNFLP